MTKDHLLQNIVIPESMDIIIFVKMLHFLNLGAPINYVERILRIFNPLLWQVELHNLI